MAPYFLLIAQTRGRPGTCLSFPGGRPQSLDNITENPFFCFVLDKQLLFSAQRGIADWVRLNLSQKGWTSHRRRLSLALAPAESRGRSAKKGIKLVDLIIKTGVCAMTGLHREQKAPSEGGKHVPGLASDHALRPSRYYYTTLYTRTAVRAIFQQAKGTSFSLFFPATQATGTFLSLSLSFGVPISKALFMPPRASPSKMQLHQGNTSTRPSAWVAAQAPEPHLFLFMDG
ncbi:uncharacterized protein MCYG_00735 [Microsporum canis CBS 113480]|uniref:Uncharacterized protein n=1 Tax=Arthroderma otae (strain ATCC MYA-4605 / CBS 113480) TaxID=554155 RepID=C5FDQ1_ARTOC|nr:uncharacterized protein MCYG_00735 [Microsporum canis CBS 113480]EEQ27847.1 predicted protein [Microsporum canis CBS 113480]